MRFRVTMKDCDGVEDAISDGLHRWPEMPENLLPVEREALADERYQIMVDAVMEWFEHREYLTVEIDTDAGTCVVVKP